jgi:SAM-dependent methyltransferase
MAGYACIRARNLFALNVLGPVRLVLRSSRYGHFGLRDLVRLEREVRASAEWRALRAEAARVPNVARRADGAGPLKYLDLDLWLRANILRGVRLGLHRAAPLRILDVGCGAGLFVYLARRWGHEASGLDRPLTELSPSERLVYGTVPAVLGVPVLRASVAAHALPSLDGSYDLVTAFMICFNGHRGPDEWGAAQWRVFLGSIAARLSPSGRVHLAFNASRARDGSRFYGSDVGALFDRCGARRERGEVTLASPRLASALGAEGTAA